MSETRFSAQNSRLGLRVDSDIDGMKALGYVETDFVGTASTSENVTSNSASTRMRAYFVDLTKGDWEFLAGQDWSLMTPNRKGLSPIPSDIFYTQVDPSFVPRSRAVVRGSRRARKCPRRNALHGSALRSALIRFHVIIAILARGLAVTPSWEA